MKLLFHLILQSIRIILMIFALFFLLTGSRELLEWHYGFPFIYILINLSLSWLCWTVFLGINTFINNSRIND
jgi:hypothetical protein